MINIETMTYESLLSIDNNSNNTYESDYPELDLFDIVTECAEAEIAYEEELVKLNKIQTAIKVRNLTMENANNIALEDGEEKVSDSIWDKIKNFFIKFFKKIWQVITWPFRKLKELFTKKKMQEKANAVVEVQKQNPEKVEQAAKEGQVNITKVSTEDGSIKTNATFESDIVAIEAIVNKAEHDSDAFVKIANKCKGFNYAKYIHQRGVKAVDDGNNVNFDKLSTKLAKSKDFNSNYELSQNHQGDDDFINALVEIHEGKKNDIVNISKYISEKTDEMQSLYDYMPNNQVQKVQEIFKVLNNYEAKFNSVGKKIESARREFENIIETYKRDRAFHEGVNKGQNTDVRKMAMSYVIKVMNDLNGMYTTATTSFMNLYGNICKAVEEYYNKVVKNNSETNDNANQSQQQPSNQQQ